MWMMHQFDARVLHAALAGNKLPISQRAMHSTNAWDLYRIVTETMRLAESKNDAIKERAVAKIRKWHLAIASVHEEFLAERGKIAPTEDPEADPLEVPDAPSCDDGLAFLDT